MHSEQDVQTLIRIAAAKQGIKLFRNNSGVAREVDPETGKVRFVRYGICNDSAKLNENLKSGDLIGWNRVLITPEMVGRTIAVFASREVKPEGWRYSGTDHEKAQLAWAQLVNDAGGDACFVATVDGIVNPHFHLRSA